MILSDGEIREALRDGHLGIEPPLGEDYLDEALTTSALDLRLGDELQFYKPLSDVAPQGLANPPVIDPSIKGVIPDLIKKWGYVQSIGTDPFDLAHGQFVLGSTLERVHLPEHGCLAARVEGKSTLARLGFVVHMTAPTIHSGFRGSIVLEMFNYGEYPIRLSSGMPVCQLIVERLGKPPLSAQTTQYQGQVTATSGQENV